MLLTFIKLPFVTKFFVLSISKRPFYTSITVDPKKLNPHCLRNLCIALL